VHIVPKRIVLDIWSKDISSYVGFNLQAEPHWREPFHFVVNSRTVSRRHEESRDRLGGKYVTYYQRIKKRQKFISTLVTITATMVSSATIDKSGGNLEWQGIVQCIAWDNLR